MADNDPPSPSPVPDPAPAADAASPAPAPSPSSAPASPPSVPPTVVSTPSPGPEVPVPIPASIPASPSSAPASVAPVTTPPSAPVSVYTAPLAATASAVSHTPVRTYASPPPVHHLAAAPTPYRPSTLPQQLKRLAYIISLALGGGAVLAGIWSAFLLPLLHATYSARAALVAPQRDRWRAVVERLREIRLIPIFPAPRPQEELEAEEAGGEGALVRARTRESEKENKTRSDAASDKAKSKVAAGNEDSESKLSPIEEDKEPGPLRLFGDVSPLTAALRDLTSSLDATATTRTSLVSTLEGYTSGLHRELFMSRGAPGAGTPWGYNNSGTSRVGLGTLGANLAKAGGSTADASPLGLPPAKSEEWDNVRREVRAIKGLLLNRRNFSLPARSAVGA